MLACYFRYVLCVSVFLHLLHLSDGQIFKFRDTRQSSGLVAQTSEFEDNPLRSSTNIINAKVCEDGSTTPLPFPPCRADDIDCLRRGVRSFFFLMDSGHLGMKPVDPLLLNSFSLSLPEQQMAVTLRMVNVTGARWTKLGDRKFNLHGSKSGVLFFSDLHAIGEISLVMAERIDPYVGQITIDMSVESNITYPWLGARGNDNEDYILIGPARIAVRNTRMPTYFIQPENPDTHKIDQVLQGKISIIDNLTNEITSSVMHYVIDNFRTFAKKIAVKYYYEYL